MDRSREWFDELIQPDIDSITDLVLKIILEHFWVLLFRGANTWFDFFWMFFPADMPLAGAASEGRAHALGAARGSRDPRTRRRGSWCEARSCGTRCWQAGWRGKHQNLHHHLRTAVEFLLTPATQRNSEISQQWKKKKYCGIGIAIWLLSLNNLRAMSLCVTTEGSLEACAGSLSPASSRMAAFCTSASYGHGASP